MNLLLDREPHRRFNPLTSEWVLVSPQRTSRPWLGMIEKPEPIKSLPYDPACYLCPGNERAGGIRNPQYKDIFVFENDFAALRPDTGEIHLDREGLGLILAESEKGICRVMCFAPRHDLTISTLPQSSVETVVAGWAEQSRTLSELEYIRYVQIFENQGAMMGASNPHPHCQIWALAHLPNEVAKEQASQSRYRSSACLLCDYLNLELREGERVVFEDEAFVVVVPFWAIWPYETLVLPRQHVGRLQALSRDAQNSLARSLKRLTMLYNRIFDAPFPYSMGFHQAPSDRPEPGEWHLHAHFYPPLLRSATVRKFMVGFEMLAMPQRDITPEAAAERLRTLAAENRE